MTKDLTDALDAVKNALNELEGMLTHFKAERVTWEHMSKEDLATYDISRGQHLSHLRSMIAKTSIAREYGRMLHEELLKH